MTEELFKPYVDSFLKMKQESTRFPNNCTTEEEKQAYIHDYEHHEGIRLNYDKVDHNQGL